MHEFMDEASKVGKAKDVQGKVMIAKGLEEEEVKSQFSTRTLFDDSVL